MWLGAAVQTVPDIDFLSSLWNGTAASLLAHRGFTHSILFDILCTLALALLAEHFHKSHKVGFKKWVMFFGVQITVHLFLDLFNTYGTGLLEPFSHHRFSFNALFVADPFFSVWPAIAFVALLILKPGARQRIFWWRFSIVACSLYLAYCSFNKIRMRNEVESVLAARKMKYNDYLTTPAPLNNWLWYIVVKEDSGFSIGYRSVFDRRDKIDFHYFPKNTRLLRNVAGTGELLLLLRFSQDYYTVEYWNDTLVFNDLRFGQITGWQDPGEKFVFHYFLQQPDSENRLVVQRGRFARWNWETIQSMYKKIRAD